MRKGLRMNFRTLKKNQPLIYCWEEYGLVLPAVVKEVYSDHAIAEADGMNLRIEDFNSDLFTVSDFLTLARIMYEENEDMDWEDYLDTEEEEIRILAVMIEEKGIEATYKFIRWE